MITKTNYMALFADEEWIQGRFTVVDVDADHIATCYLDIELSRADFILDWPDHEQRTFDVLHKPEGHLNKYDPDAVVMRFWANIQRRHFINLVTSFEYNTEIVYMRAVLKGELKMYTDRLKDNPG